MINSRYRFNIDLALHIKRSCTEILASNCSVISNLSYYKAAHNNITNRLSTDGNGKQFNSNDASLNLLNYCDWSDQTYNNKLLYENINTRRIIQVIEKQYKIK